MPSKPRHGRDYRKRTPRNSDLVQAPGASNAFVNIVQVNMTGNLQLTIDFDHPIQAVGDPANFLITLDPNVSDIIADPITPSAKGQSAAIVTNNVDPSNGRITVEFDVGDIPGGVIDPATQLFYLAAAAENDTKFPGRLLYPGSHGQLVVIDVP